MTDLDKVAASECTPEEAFLDIRNFIEDMIIKKRLSYDQERGIRIKVEYWFKMAMYKAEFNRDEFDIIVRGPSVLRK